MSPRCPFPSLDERPRDIRTMRTCPHSLVVGMAVALACASSVQAQISGFAPGTGTLREHALPFTVPANARTPLLSAMLLVRDGDTPVYYLSTGLGVPRFGIPDDPGAAAWRVVPDADCAHLETVPLAEAKHPAVQAVTVQKSPLPMVCAAAFEGSCTSRDQQLRITTTFRGRQRTAKIGGGFFGTEARIDSTFYTGVRSLTIEHLPTGRLLRMDEALKDSNGYSAPQTAIRYLPELRRVLLLGATTLRGMPQAGCIVLPSAEGSAASARP